MELTVGEEELGNSGGQSVASPGSFQVAAPHSMSRDRKSEYLSKLQLQFQLSINSSTGSDYPIPNDFPHLAGVESVLRYPECCGGLH
jgi:hypothetical protein